MIQKFKTSLRSLSLNKSTITEDEQDLEFLVERHKKLKVYRGHTVKRYYSGMNQLMATVLSVLVKLNPQHKAKIENMFIYFGLNRCLNLSDTMEILKELSVLAKKGKERFDPLWYIYIDWNVTLGYNMSTILSDMDEELKIWFEDDLFRSSDEFNYNDKFKAALVDVLKSGKSVTKLLTIQEWVQDPANWVTKGSSGGYFVTVMVDGVEVKSKKNKTAVSVKYTTDELIGLIFDSNIAEELKPSIKVELGRKDRIIVAAGFVNQLRMGYISYWLKHFIHLDDQFDSTLWKGGDGLANFWTMRSERVRHRQEVNFPMDVTSFDRGVATNEILIYLDVLRYYIDLSVLLPLVKKDLLNIMDVIEITWFKSKIKLSNNSIIYPKHGLPSGVRWTSELGTLVNLARIKMCDNHMKDIWGTNFVNYVAAQGDDDDICVNNYFQAVQIFDFYNKVGISIHPQKNFVSDKESEFLRRIIDKDGVRGYPVRRLMSLIFRDPTASRDPTDILFLTNLCSAYSVLIGRLCDENACYKDLIEQVYLRFKTYLPDVKKKECEMYVRTPLSVGGLGFKPWDYKMGWVSCEFVSKSDRVYLPRLTGVQFEKYNRTSLAGPLDYEKLKNQIEDSLTPDEVRKLRCEEVRMFHPVIKLNRDRYHFRITLNSKFKWDRWRVRDDLINTFYTFLVDYACLTDNIQTMYYYTHPSLHDTFSKFQVIMSKTLFKMWMKDKINVTVPMIPPFADFFVSKICNSCFSYGMINLTRRHRITKNDLLDLNLQVELFVTRNLHSHMSALPIVSV